MSAAEEAGFTLVEVLAALTIASLTILMALQLFTAGARVSDRMIKETAARDLMRQLLASDQTGAGHAGALDWAVSVSLPKDGLVTRQVAVHWASGAGTTATRIEAAP
jgi:prepilin-type N-terminal cleavage/methylation domain-containing protein